TRFSRDWSSDVCSSDLVIVPAFSIGRTQELLYELEGLIHKGGPRWKSLEVIVDSPLAAKFTQVYRELKPFWDAEAQQRLRTGRQIGRASCRERWFTQGD